MASTSPMPSSTFIPALLVIDMQYDFVHGSLAIADATSIIDTINSLLTLPFITKIASKDFHPQDHVSFGPTHNLPVGSKITVYPPDDPLKERGMEQIMWPIHCVASTPGSEFVEGLNTQALDAVVHKGTHPGVDFYSAFRDAWRYSTTELPALLEARGVTDVFLVGLTGDYCVKETAIDAVAHGYKTWVVQDAVKSVSEHGSQWKDMQEHGVRFLDSTEVVRKLR